MICINSSEQKYRDLNSSVEEFFAKGYGQTGPKVNQANIISLFNRYKDPQTNQMEGDGIANFFD